MRGVATRVAVRRARRVHVGNSTSGGGEPPATRPSSRARGERLRRPRLVGRGREGGREGGTDLRLARCRWWHEAGSGARTSCTPASHRVRPTSHASSDRAPKAVRPAFDSFEASNDQPAARPAGSEDSRLATRQRARRATSNPMGRHEPRAVQAMDALAASRRHYLPPSRATAAPAAAAPAAASAAAASTTAATAARVVSRCGLRPRGEASGAGRPVSGAALGGLDPGSRFRRHGRLLGAHPGSWCLRLGGLVGKLQRKECAPSVRRVP